MKLSVYVLGQEIAVLEQVGDFKGVLTYRPETAPDNPLLCRCERSRGYGITNCIQSLK
jgi:hypothetical protein